MAERPFYMSSKLWCYWFTFFKILFKNFMFFDLYMQFSTKIKEITLFLQVSLSTFVVIRFLV